MADAIPGFVPDAQQPPQGGIPGFVPDAPPRSALGEIGAGFKRFFPAAAQSIAASSAGAQELAGKTVDPVTQSALDANSAALKANAPDRANHNWVTNFAASVPETIGGMAGMAGAQASGELSGAAVAAPTGPGALIGGAFGGGAAMGAQQYAQRYHEALQEGKEANIPDPEGYAKKEAQVAGGVGAAFGAVPLIGPGLRAGAKALGIGAAKSAAEVGAGLTEKTFGRSLAEHAAQNQAGLTAASVGQNVASNENKKEAGLPSVSPWEAAQTGFTSSIEGGGAFLPFMALKAHTDVKTALQLQATLNNGDAHPQARMRAVQTVYDAMKKEDPDGAHMWGINAQKAIVQGKPIGLGNDWTT
jgi:hypothetical protein